MPRTKPRTYRRVYVGAVALVVVLLSVSLWFSREDAIDRMERLAFTQIQLLEATLNNTLREAEVLLALVADASETSEHAMELVQRRMIFADQVANAGVYREDCSLVGALRATPPFLPPRTPESIRALHHDQGVHTSMQFIADEDASPALWFSHSLEAGCVVVAVISEQQLRRSLHLILGDGIDARILNTAGAPVVTWGESDQHWDEFLRNNVGYPGRALHTEYGGSHVFALMQLQSYPLHVSLRFGPQMFLSSWRSRAAVETLLVMLGLLVLGLLLRSSTRQQEQRYLVRERETLVQETNHRVKNNLSVIDSLLSLGADATTDPNSLSLISGLRGRIAAITLLHDALHRSERLSDVPLREYCTKLVRQVQEAYSMGEARIDLHIDELDVPADPAKRLGLILHELVANAFKYGHGAAPTSDPGVLELTVEFRVTDPTWALVAQDSGPGFPAEPQVFRKGSMGLSLVESLAKELSATVERENREGARVTVRGPLTSLSAGSSVGHG